MIALGFQSPGIVHGGLPVNRSQILQVKLDPLEGANFGVSQHLSRSSKRIEVLLWRNQIGGSSRILIRGHHLL